MCTQSLTGRGVEEGGVSSLALQALTHICQCDYQNPSSGCATADPMVEHSHLAIVHSLLVWLNLNSLL